MKVKKASSQEMGMNEIQNPHFNEIDGKIKDEWDQNYQGLGGNGYVKP